MESAKIQEVVERLVGSGIARPDEIRGCSEAEIHDLERQSGVRFPGEYRAFLSAMGQGAGRFFRGTDMFFAEIPKLRLFADELLDELGNPFQLPGSSFVFSVHQGYQFMYFIADDGIDDPPVYSFMEGDEGPTLRWDHFSGFLMSAIDQHL